MMSDGAALASVFANLRVFRAGQRIAKNYGKSSLQVTENRDVRERLKSLPR